MAPGILHLQGRLGIEGGDGVGEDHLGDDPVGLQLGLPAVVVPVPAGVLAHEVVERHPVLPGPVVELGMEGAREIVAVVEEVGRRRGSRPR